MQRLESPFAVSVLRQMQHAPDGDGQCACHLLRIILLQSRDRSPYVVRKKAVNRSTIVTQPLQVPLQRSNIGRVFNQLTPRHRIIGCSTSIARREIRLVNSRPTLMRQVQLVARRQNVSVMKKRRIGRIIDKNFPKLRAGSLQSENEHEQDELFHKRLVGFGWFSSKWKIRRR